MATTISGVHLSSVTLSTAAQNPATVATGATISASGTALIGVSGTYWNVINNGLLEGTTGISLASGGSVSDGTSSSISGTTYGIVLGNSGSVTNGTGANITAGKYAVEINNGAGTVINSGTISGQNVTIGKGVVLAAGGYVANTASASITGGTYGVEIVNAAGTVVNSGSIASTNPGQGFGIYLGAGGSVTNAAFASIASNGTGVAIKNAGGRVENSGSISGGTAGFGVFLQKGGYVTNAASALISGGIGVEIAGSPGSVVNSGTIGDSSTTAGAGVYLKAGGFVTNNGSGSIHGNVGVEIAGGGGTLVNYGTIGTTNATLGSGVLLKSGGYVTNAAAATISGSADGVVISGGSGSIVNAGTIDGINAVVTSTTSGSLASNPSFSVTSSVTNNITSFGGAGISLSSGDPVTNKTSAVISGGKYGIEISGGAGTIVNAGTIGGLGAIVTYSTTINVTSNPSGSVISSVSGSVTSFTGVAVSLASGGYVTNATSALISGGQYGIEIKGGSGTVINSGTVSQVNKAGGAGIYLSNGAPFTNKASGLVTAAGRGVVLQAGGSVLNAGRIIGGTYGLKLADVGTVVNSGTISATNATSSIGVDLKSGGTVTNQAHGLIRGNIYAIHAADTTSVTNAASASINGGRIGIDILANGTILNSGNIIGSGGTSDSGIYLKSGYVLNALQATIDGGVNFSNATGAGAGTVVNSGAIKANYPVGPKYGVAFHQSGTLTNTSTGSIAAHGYGVLLGNGGSVLNSGTIVGSFGNTINGSGVYLKAGGSVTNFASATIKGIVGIDLLAGGSVTNAGTIAGTGGKAIAFYGTASDQVIVDAGAVFTGAVVGSASASNTLELAAGGSGTLSGIGTNFVNFGTVAVDNGATWELTGANTLASGSTLTNNGTLTLSGATLSDAGSVINNGKIKLDPSTMSVATLSGAGTVTIDAGSTLAVQGTVSSGQHIVFNGGAAELDLGAPSNFSNTLTGFVSGDKIGLTTLTNVAGSHADMDYTTNVLTVTEGSASYQFQFDKSQSFAGDFFHLASQGGGTVITEDQIACYCRGTRIATATGEIPVEALSIGDEIMTASGVARPIKWIGKRSYGGRFILGRKDILPICITAGSLGEGLPRRDLWISPHHAMYLDGLLIEAKDLINGTSIIQAEEVECVEYFHIELDSHDVILAEGAPSETFLDDDSRGMFHNAQEYTLLYPNEEERPTRYCAPRLDEGFAVEAVRRRLAQRASAQQPEKTETLRGYVDVVSAGAIEGWAQSADHPDAPVCLDIYAGDRLIGQTLANLYRQDLRDAGLGSGRHAFVYTPPDGTIFPSARVEVRRSLDGALLGRSNAAHGPLAAAG